MISLSQEVEAFVPKNHSEKEDGSLITKGEILKFQILDFSKENKKILASHKATFKASVKNKSKSISSKKVMKKMEEDKQQSTLGDLATYTTDGSVLLNMNTTQQLNFSTGDEATYDVVITLGDGDGTIDNRPQASGVYSDTLTFTIFDDDV